jgi:ferrous iron transport protein A
MSKVPNVITLDALPTGQHGTVVHLAPSGEHAADTGVDVSRRLMELGFVPGERIRILKRALPGGYPLAVKVGQSTFALRRFEAALVSVAAE